MKRQFAVCQSCSVVLANADDSHIAPEDLAEVTATIEEMGLVAHVETEHNDGYWNCDVCSAIYCGDDSEIWEES